jgi:hypothetical protein
MTRTRCALAVLVGTVLLVLWNGLTQLFPWGLGAVSNFSATSGESYALAAPRLEEAPPGTWTTPAFEAQLGNGISTLATDDSFSWIVAVPRERYDPARYVSLHILSQAAIALFLVLVLWPLQRLRRTARLASVLLLGVAAMLGSHGTMMVWWGTPAAYAVGSAGNLLAGWLLAFSAIDRIVLGKLPRSAN